MKLSGKLPQPEAEILQRGTDMIVNQVAAMQRMVDDFRDYARTPPSVLRMFSARMPHAESAVIAETGHSSYWESPEEFNRTVLAFIQKH